LNLDISCDADSFEDWNPNALIFHPVLTAALELENDEKNILSYVINTMGLCVDVT
jgi:hypothetical protein